MVGGFIHIIFFQRNSTKYRLRKDVFWSTATLLWVSDKIYKSETSDLTKPLFSKIITSGGGNRPKSGIRVQAKSNHDLQNQ